MHITKRERKLPREEFIKWRGELTAGSAMQLLDGGRGGCGGGTESDRLQGGSMDDASEVAGDSPEW